MPSYSFRKPASTRPSNFLCHPSPLRSLHRHTGFPARFLPLTHRPPSPEWNVLLNNRTPNGERSGINPQSTIPLRDPLGGPRIYVRYASPRRSYVRAIEKTVSSLIPPTATFRLPAAWQRIGSADWGEKERERAKVIGEECEGAEGRKRSFEQSYAILIPLPIPLEHVRSQFEIPPSEKWDSSDLFLPIVRTREQGLFSLLAGLKLH